MISVTIPSCPRSHYAFERYMDHTTLQRRNIGAGMRVTRLRRSIAGIAIAVITAILPAPAAAQRGGTPAIQKSKEDVLIAMRDGVRARG